MSNINNDEIDYKFYQIGERLSELSHNLGNLMDNSKIQFSVISNEIKVINAYLCEQFNYLKKLDYRISKLEEKNNSQNECHGCGISFAIRKVCGCCGYDWE